MSDVAEAGKYAEKHFRVRLSEPEIETIVSALRHQQGSNISVQRKAMIGQLIDRLIERRPGRH